MAKSAPRRARSEGAHRKYRRERIAAEDVEMLRAEPASRIPPPSAPLADLRLADEERATRAYRPDIDGLRAVAVLAVIVYHIEASWLPGGFTGVDVFFVISGYVVTGSLLRKQHESPAAFLLAFYARRVKRLAPALIAVVIVTSLLIAYAIPAWNASLDGYYLSAMISLVGFANQHFAMLPTGYFDEGADGLKYNPFTHCWSLGVEEQFYFVFAPMLLLIFGRDVARSLAFERSERCHATFLIVALLASAATCAVMTIRTPTLAYYLLPSRFWQLMSGAAFFVIEPRGADSCTSAAAQLLLEFVAVGLLVVAFLYTPSNAGFPFPCSLPSIAGALCVIASGGKASTCVGCGIHTPLLLRPLHHPVMVYVGKLSYPLYLWHWPTLVLFRSTVSLTSLDNKLRAANVIALGGVVLYHGVEGIVRAWRPTRNWVVFALFGTLLAGTEVMLFLLRGPLQGQLYQLKLGFSFSSPVSLPSAPPISLPSSPPSITTNSSPPSEPPPPVRSTITPSPPPLPPASPSPPWKPPSDPPPVCAVSSHTSSSVFTEVHPMPHVNEKHSLSQYSTFTARQCRCQLSETRTAHRPPHAVEADPTGAPCFLPSHPSELNSMEDYFYKQPCFFGSDNTPPFDNDNDDDAKVSMLHLELPRFLRPCTLPALGVAKVEPKRDVRTESLPPSLDWFQGLKARVRRCLTPHRSGTLPQRAVFLIGDSHTGAIAPGLMTALNGAAAVTWLATSYQCGYVSDSFIFETGFIADTNLEHPCKVINMAIDEALRSQLKECDIVVLHQHSFSDKFGYGMGKLEGSPQVVRSVKARIRELQKLVLSKSARLVLLGDTAELPQSGQHCATPALAHLCEIPMAVAKQQLRVERELYSSMALTPGTFYIKLDHLMCDTTSKTCGAYIPGTNTLGYSDYDHLNSSRDESVKELDGTSSGDENCGRLTDEGCTVGRTDPSALIDDDEKCLNVRTANGKANGNADENAMLTVTEGNKPLPEKMRAMRRHLQTLRPIDRINELGSVA
ncbi:MAG: hypothetical protein SGPRY_011198 [Prymnesium sp.]